MNYQFLIPLNPEKIIQYLKKTLNYVHFKLVLKKNFAFEKYQGKRD